MMNSLLEQWHELMKPMLPAPFDGNEYFTIASTLIVLAVFFYVHRRKPALLQTEIVAILLFNLLYATIGDYFLAMKPYDFYNTVDHDSGELMDLLLQNVVYPFTLLIMMHVYASLQPRRRLFIPICTAVLVLLEWIGEEYFQLYTYKSWKLWYSAVFYIFVLIVNVLFFIRFRHTIHRLRAQVENHP
ncbi:CBO0543 family protein [Paenibacillus sp. PL2-23]|uniref:CBO0543 family protein n=1 Tax=Paenibacillus sp. PL2-23 TaxID=2100729 RepID=UPI0030F99ADB